jgi:thiosulfate/3-mercaptopyruvate sulfurtransferase
MPEILVPAEWVQQHLNDDNVRIFDMRSPVEYSTGHIPNAVLIHYDKIVDFDPAKPFFDIAPKERIEALLSEKGINNNSKIAIYGDRGGASASKLFWVLEFYGANVALLEISFSAWKMKGYPVTRDVPKPQPAKFTAKTNKDYRVSAEYISSKLGKPNVILVDTRNPEEYEGLIASSPRPGRIPSSVNLPWFEGASMEKLFKDKNELEKLFSSKGITKDKEVIAYCQVGERASHTFLALRLAGYPNAKIYDRSFSEWSARSDLPVEQ